jgi:hypothetical protein
MTASVEFFIFRGSLNLKTEDVLSDPGAGGKTSKYKTEREESAEEESHRHKQETREHWFRMGLITALLVAMVSIVTSASSQEGKKWGFGIIGTIAGFAVRGPL